MIRAVPAGNRLQVCPREYEDHRHKTCQGFEKMTYQSL